MQIFVEMTQKEGMTADELKGPEKEMARGPAGDQVDVLMGVSTTSCSSQV